MKKTSIMYLMLMLGILMAPPPIHACSCAWKGPFLTVAKDAPLVVRGKVLRHHPGKKPTMDVLVLEPFQAGFWTRG